MDLQGKTVLVTGGALRIGAALCHAFADAGCRVIIHYRSSRTEAETLRQALAHPEIHHGIEVCDLTDPDLAAEMVRCVKPDILVNNASCYHRNSFDQEDARTAGLQFSVNFLAPAAMIRAFAEVLTAPCGAVVNLIDADVDKTDPRAFSYSLSKKMLRETTRTTALTYAPRIRVNAVAPGASLPPQGLEHLGMKKTLEILPMHRAADPRDIASAVLFLAANDSITGQTLFVDCGQSLTGYLR